MFSLRLYNSGSPSPFLTSPLGIVISTWTLFGVAGSQWMNFVFKSLFGSSDMNENVLGFILSTLSVLRFRRCINL